MTRERTGPGADAVVSLERRFMGWDRPALEQAAAILCDHYTDQGAIRLDRAVVVLPGARAGRRLKELLVEAAARAGLPLVPPRVATIGALPALLHQPDRPPAADLLKRRVWVEALRAAPDDRIAAVFPRRPSSQALAEWAGLAREAAGLQRQVAGAGLRFRDVAARCGESELFDDFNRWDVLAAVQAEYEERLASLGWSDPDLTRIDAVAAGAVRAERDIWLVAVAEMPAVVRRMLAVLADAGHPVRALVHAPEDRADGFDDAGAVRADAWLDAPIPLDDDRLAVVDRPEHQALEVARVLAAQDGRRSAEEIVIGVPRREVAPFIEQRLTDAGVPVHDAAGERVSRSRPYRLLAALADYLDGRRFDAFAALVRHPDLWPWVGLDPSDGWLASLDRYYCEHLPGRLDGTLPGPESDRHRARVEHLVAAIDGALTGDAAAVPLGGKAGLRAWAGRAVALLHDIYSPQPPDPGGLRGRRLVAALAALGDAAMALRRLPAALDEECHAPAAFRLLLDECAAAIIPADPERAAVELLGWLELHLDDAPLAVITGVNEPDLPESVSAHAFLPDGLRSRLGMVDNDRRYARDAYHLTAILHSRDEVRLIAGRRSATGDPLRPSRLVLATDARAVAQRVRRFYDHDAPAGATATAAAPAAAGATAAAPSAAAAEAGHPIGEASHGFRLPPEPVIEAPSPITRLRVTDFRALLQDPYGFALDRLLRLEPLDDAAREMDALVFGKLAHQVLERFGRSPDHRALADGDAIFQALSELLDRASHDRFGPRPQVAVKVQVEQIRARLRRFAVWQAAWVADGWEIRSAECATPAEGVAFDVDGEPIQLTARVDRVDHNPATGAWAVFDYKTSDGGADPEKTHRRGRGANRTWVDLQLPLYRWVLPALVDGAGAPIAPVAPTATVRLGYLALPRQLDAVTACFADWSAGELETAYDVARDVVRRVRTGVFTFDPDGPGPRFSDPRMDALLGRGHLVADDDDPGADAATGEGSE